MTVSAATSLTLADHLPRVRGKYEFDAPLAKLTWFKVGGPAAVLFTPRRRRRSCQLPAGSAAGGALAVPWCRLQPVDPRRRV